MLLTPVGSEPAQLALVELESTSLDHSGNASLRPQLRTDDNDIDYAWQLSWSLWRAHPCVLVNGSVFQKRCGSAAQGDP